MPHRITTTVITEVSDENKVADLHASLKAAAEQHGTNVEIEDDGREELDGEADGNTSDGSDQNPEPKKPGGFFGSK